MVDENDRERFIVSQTAIKFIYACLLNDIYKSLDMPSDLVPKISELDNNLKSLDYDMVNRALVTFSYADRFYRITKYIMNEYSNRF